MVRIGNPAGLMIEARLADAPAGLIGDRLGEWHDDQRRWAFGFMCFWAGGTAVGDISFGLSFSVMDVQCRALLASRGRRESPELFEMPASRCFQTIDDAIFLYDPAQSEEEMLRDVARYHRFTALPLDDTFRDDKAYLVESGPDARYVWSRHRSGTVHELRLRAGEFDALLDELLARFEAARPR